MKIITFALIAALVTSCAPRTLFVPNGHYGDCPPCAGEFWRRDLVGRWHLIRSFDVCTYGPDGITDDCSDYNGE